MASDHAGRVNIQVSWRPAVCLVIFPLFVKQCADGAGLERQGAYYGDLKIPSICGGRGGGPGRPKALAGRDITDQFPFAVYLSNDNVSVVFQQPARPSVQAAIVLVIQGQ
jgi:hypothetical protein